MNKKAFTLVEVIVSITILAIIMISIMTIFTLSAEVSARSDLNRNVQENIKNTVETIAEDIRKNGISGVSQSTADSYSILLGTGSALKIGSGSQENFYYLTDFHASPSNIENRVALTFCQDIKNTCTIYKKGYGPLTNSTLSFTDLEFYVTNGPVRKVTVKFTARPAHRNGVRMSLLKDSVMDFQTTLSERNLQVK